MATPDPSAASRGFKTNGTKGAVSGSGGALQTHDYVSNNAKVQIETAGYFNPVRDFLKVGDTINVAGDLDGTPFISSYVVATIPAGGDVTITEMAAITQNVLQVATVRVTALGTASNHYIPSPVAGSLTAVYGVSNGANGNASSTIGISIDGGDKATLTFSDSYTAGTVVSDTEVDANTLTLGEAITIDNNGEGDGTGEVTVLLVFTPG